MAIIQYLGDRIAVGGDLGDSYHVSGTKINQSDLKNVSTEYGSSCRYAGFSSLAKDATGSEKNPTDPEVIRNLIANEAMTDGFSINSPEKILREFDPNTGKSYSGNKYISSQKYDHAGMIKAMVKNNIRVGASAGDNHMVIINGYEKINGQSYFTVHDPTTYRGREGNESHLTTHINASTWEFVNYKAGRQNEIIPTSSHITGAPDRKLYRYHYYR